MLVNLFSSKATKLDNAVISSQNSIKLVLYRDLTII